MPVICYSIGHATGTPSAAARESGKSFIRTAPGDPAPCKVRPTVLWANDAGALPQDVAELDWSWAMTGAVVMRLSGGLVQRNPTEIVFGRSSAHFPETSTSYWSGLGVRIVTIFRYGCDLMVCSSSNIVRASRVSTTRLGQSHATKSFQHFLAGVEEKVRGAMISNGFRLEIGSIGNRTWRQRSDVRPLCRARNGHGDCTLFRRSEQRGRARRSGIGGCGRARSAAAARRCCCRHCCQDGRWSRRCL